MAKFLPLVGELVTAFESGAKLVAAGATAPFNPEAAKQLLKSSGDAWVNYSQESVLACAVRHDGGGIVKGLDGFSKGCPLVAHVRGVYHLAKGEKEEGKDCLANGTKAIGVIGATVAVTVATAGLGTAAACAAVGTAAAASQVGLDAVESGVRRKAVGTVAGAKLAYETGDAVHIADAIIAPVQTAAMAAGGAAIGRGLAARAAAAEQNLSGTGHNLTPPKAQPNSQLTPAALDRLPPRPAGHPSALPSRPAGPPAATPAQATPGPSAASATSATTVSEAVGSGSGASLPAKSEYSVRDSCLSDVHDSPAVPPGSRVPMGKSLKAGKYKYVVQKDGSGGTVVRLQRFDISERCHADCAGGVNSKVIHAGEVELVNPVNPGAQGARLVVKRFNSCSGHFKPKPFDPQVSLFQGDAFPKVVEPFMQHFDVPRNVAYLGKCELMG